MDFDKKPDISKLNATVKASNLILELRSAFQQSNFSKVQEILVSREKTMSEEIDHWKRAYILMEKKHGEVILDRILVDEELSNCERKLRDLAGQVARLEEDKMLDHEKEILVAREKRMVEEIGHLKSEYESMENKLREEAKGRVLVAEEHSKCKRELGELAYNVARLEEDKKLNLEKIKVSGEREKRALDMYKELLEDFEKVKRENVDLVVKNTESESARAKAERELECAKNKNVEYDMRITRLEREVEVMINQQCERSKERVNSSEPQVEQVISNMRADGVDNKVNQLNEAGPCVAGAGVVIHPCNRGLSIPRQTEVEGGGSSSQREKRQKTGPSDLKTIPAVFIEITDSDDDMPTQNQPCNVPSISNGAPNGDNRVISGSKWKASNDDHNNGFIDWSSSDSDSDSDSCGTVAIERIVAQRKASKS